MIMSAAEYASSKILPRLQNLRTNVNISVTLQDSSLEKLEKLSSFSYLPSTNFQIETAATAFLCGYRSTRTAWRVTQWTEIPPTSGAHLSVGSGSV
jgi:hypothetical protein